MNAKHALLSASGSARWMACPGSVSACKNYEQSSSEAADEGTLAHEMAEHHLIKGTNPENDGEMGDYVQVYLDLVRSLPGEAFIEQRVDFSEYAPEGFGTSDYISLDMANRTLYIADLKYGKGVKVSAQENTQLMLYALGAVEEFSYLCKIEKVSMIICQPRLDWIDEYTLSVLELEQFGELVKQRAQLALDEDAPRIPGDKQCLWCPHKAVCPELFKLTQDTLMAEFDDLIPVNRLKDEQLRFVLDNSKLIISWLSAVEDLVKTRVETSNDFPGYKLVAGRSSREWVNPEHAATILSGTYSEDQLFEKSFISPAKAEKLVGKKNLDEITPLITKKSGKPTLVPESDPRPSIMVSAEDFED